MKKNLTLLLLCCVSILSAQVTIVPNGSSWKYLDNGSNAGTAWYSTTFNDAAWASGNSELGYGDGDETTVVNACGTVTTFPSCSNKYITTYFRKTINVTSASSYTAFTANLRRDDGIVLYVNGVEVYRNNMPTGTITYSTPASTACADDGTLVLSPTIASSIITTGTNVIAAEIHQNAGSSSDISFEFNLMGNTAPAATATLFPYGSAWKYMDNGSDQGTSWYSTAFSDATWAAGNSELGYGDGDEATVVNACGTVTTYPTCSNKYITTYFRKTINIPSASSYTAYTINLRRDDGIIVYFNGSEVYRNNMPTGAVNYTTLSSTNCSDDGTQVFTATLPGNVMVTGTNVIAAEVHQTGGTSSDVSFEFNLVAVTNSVVTSPPPGIVKGPYLQLGTQNSMVVRWESDAASDSKVMYGTNAASLTSVVSSTASVTAHIMQLSGLAPYTKYYYSIGTSTAVMQGDSSNYFVTSPVPGTAGKYRFWVVGDCGNASTNQTNCKNQYKNYNGNGVTNGWLLLGDNAYDNGSDSQFNSEFFGIYQNDVMKNIPLWPAPGNHDYNNGASTATTNPYFTYFTTPTNAEAGGIASNNPAYYSYDYGNIHFISLDSYGTTGAAQKMYDTTGAQALWLKQDLAANTKKWTIAYWHHPPYTMGSHNSDSESDLAAIRQNFIRILERNKVDMIMCGHSHDYERSRLMNGHYGAEATFTASVYNLSSSSGLYDGSTNSCPYTKDSTVNKIGTVYVLSGSAGQLGGQQTSFPHDAMYYSNATNGGSFILDIEDNKLEAKWLCADGAIRDKFTIFKDVDSKKTYTVQPGQTTTLTASWPGSYSWNNAITSRSITATVASDSTIWVKDPNSCVADTFRLKVLPAVSFSASSVPFCTGQSISLSDLSTNNTNSWLWSVTPSIGAVISNTVTKNPSVTFNTAGTYTVSLSAGNINGMGLLSSHVFTVSTTPNVIAASSATAICMNQTVGLTASGAATYSWSSGASTASISITPTATSVYVLTGSSSAGCQASDSKTVIVNPLPVVTVTATPASAMVCSGNPLSLNAAGASTLSWSNGLTNGAAFTPTSTTTYTLTGTDANGCQNTTMQTVTVNALPILTVTANPATATVCNGATLSLNAAGAATLNWNSGLTNGTAFTPTATAAYTVTGTDNNGCQNTAVKSITVNSTPALTITVNPANATVCSGSTLSLNAAGASTLSWSNGLINGSSFTPTATATYTLTGTAVNGCQSTALASVTVNTVPVLSVTANPANAGICNGSTLSLNAAGATTLNWSNGVINGSSFTPTANATYTLTGTDTNGCQSTTVQSVTVNALPALTITTAPANAAICNGSTLSLNAAGAATLTWSNGITNNASFTPGANATYTVTGIDNNGCQSTAVKSITVNAVPVITVTTNPANATVCNGSTLSLNAAGASIGTYTWTNGLTNGASFTPTASGVYTVTGSLNGCQGAATASITVNALPVLSTTVSSAICAGQIATLTAGGAATYSWNNGSTNAGISVTPTISSTYTVTGTGANNCQNTSIVTVTVHALPVVSVTANPSAVVCAGGTLALNGTGAVTYAWNSGITNGTAFTPTANGSYTVTGTDTNGCQNTAIQSVSVNALPVITVDNSSAICAGQTATAQANGALTYNWSNGSTGAIFSSVLTSAANYTVTGTDANGCKNTAVANFVVNQLPGVNATTSSSMICSGESATLSSAGANSYSWNNNATGSSIIVNPTENTSYTVTGTGSNGCSNRATITQNVSECTSLKTISASGNNISVYPNPNAGTFNIELNRIGDFNVEIYNTIGEHVYTGKLTTGSNSISLNVKHGIYFYTITNTKNVVSTGKLIIE